MTAKPRPQTDAEIGEICAWLKANQLRACVTINGAVTLKRLKPPTEERENHVAPQT